MNIVVEIVAPIVALIAVGYGAARFRVIDSDGVRALSDVTFLLFLPALLFGAMARTSFEKIAFDAPVAYFSVALAIFFTLFAIQRARGFESQQAVLHSLAGIFSNNVMLGVPLVRLAFGEAGLAVLLTIIAMHALILLSVATLMLEFARAMAPGAEGDAAAPVRSRLRRLLAALRPALRSALVHPVVLPIIAGVAWSLLHLNLPGPIDAALKLMASAATPMCLVLLGASLAQYGVSAGWGSVAALSALKNLLHPLLAYVAGRWLFGLDTLTLSVLTIAAGLPIGANVYLLAQRYRVELPIVSGAVSLSTVVGGVTLPILLAWLR